MSNLPMERKKLNFWQKLRIRFYLLRKYKAKRFEKAPDYIKKDPIALRKMIEGELEGRRDELSTEKLDMLYQHLKNNPELFVFSTRKTLIEYALLAKKYEIVSLLDEGEQYEAVIRNKKHYKEILPFINSQTARRLLAEKRELEGDETDYSWGDEYKLDYKPNFIKYLNKEVQMEIIQDNKDLICMASEEVQMEYLMQNNDDIELVSDSVRKKFLNGNIEFLTLHPEYVRRTSDETQLLFATEKRENLKHIDYRLQLELIKQHPGAFKYADEQLKDLIFNPKKFKDIFREEPFELTNILLNNNTTNFRYLPNVMYIGDIAGNSSIDTSIGDEYFNYIIKNLNTIDETKIKDIFIKSGLLYAMGNLRNKSSSFYSGQEHVEGFDIYTRNQKKVIQKLDNKQIVELIKIDANYIMPYITEIENNNRIEPENIEKHKNRCKEVLLQLYGTEKFSQFEECIDFIFEQQLKFQNESGIKDFNGYDTTEYKIPLESLKLLFNETIISTNSPEQIREYYQKLFSDTNEREVFIQIIENAYGEKATNILQQRPELDVYGINSLEIFDKRIMDNFSEEFVHDLLSYNVRNFTAFLNIVKSENELELFKQYYGILSNVMGANVETMQKAIFEFYYNKEILENTKNVDLTELQQSNLVAVLCGRANQFDITTIEELDRFDEIANEQLKARLELALEERTMHDQRPKIDIKDLLFENIFGIKEKEVSLIDKLYDITDRDSMLSEDEREIAKCIRFILEEKDKSKLVELAFELMSKEGIRNPISLYSLISKTRERGIENLNRKLLSKEKIDRLIEDRTQGIRKFEKDGVEIYSFEGYNMEYGHLGFLAHRDDNANGRDIMTADGQSGMSTISTSLYFGASDIINQKPHFLFTEIEGEDMVAYANDDANTSHVPKLVRSQGKISGAGYWGQRGVVGDRLNDCTSEVSFYRRTRNHSKRNEENPDGRIKPSFICVVYEGNGRGKIEDAISAKDMEYAKKHNIPIIIFYANAYREKRRLGYGR